MFYKLVVTFIVAAWPIQTWAASDYPGLGMLFHTKEASSLQHDCKVDSSQLVCGFTQTSVRHKLNPNKFEEKIKEARNKFRKNQTGFDDKACASAIEYHNKFGKALRTGIAPERMKGLDRKAFIKGLASMSKTQKLNVISMLNAGVKYCGTKMEKYFLEFTRINLEKDMHTCSVSPNTYSQRFKFFPDTGNWVVTQDGPTGACGIVNVSRFQPEKTKYGVFWKYFAKKVVTNKSGNTILLKCSDLDEEEYEYDWRSREIELGCEYITFGVF